MNTLIISLVQIIEKNKWTRIPLIALPVLIGIQQTTLLTPYKIIFYISAILLAIILIIFSFKNYKQRTALYFILQS